MKASALLAVVLSLLTVSAFAADGLAGIWLRDGRPYAELKADGTGVVDGSPVQWKSDGRTLTVSDGDGEVLAVLPYTLKRDRLSIPVEGRPDVLTRASAKTKAPAGKNDLAQLLLSSPWCSFKYNKISGSSSQERVIFRGDGTWASGRRAESYSSGKYGTVSGQSDSGDAGRWRVQGGRLMLGVAEGALEDAGLTVSRNSNGYPILKADGKEYSQCR